MGAVRMRVQTAAFFKKQIIQEFKLQTLSSGQNRNPLSIILRFLFCKKISHCLPNDSHFVQKRQFKDINVLMDLFLTNKELFNSHDVNCWTGVDWIIVMFLICCLDSFWRHPFTAEDLMVSEWCNVKFLQICSHEETNLHLGWLKSE